MDEKEVEVGEAMASDAEDHNHKLDVDSKRFEEMMGATLAAADVGHHGVHEDHIEVVEDHHLQQLDLNNLEHHDDDQDHPTDVGVELHHLLPLSLSEHGHEHVLEHDDVKDQHHQHPDQQHVQLVSMDEEGAGALSPAAVSAALDGTTAQQLGLMAPPPSEGDHHATTQQLQQPAADDSGEVPANTQKIVKRGRGGRRAGAGRKRKSDTAKAEAEAAAAAAADPTRVATSTTTTKSSLPPPPRASVGAGSGLAGPPPPKKKKLSTSSPALADDAMDGGGYGKAPRQLRFGKTILYVREVETTVDFYERAFGLRRRFVHETKQYAELETGSTALAFASNELARNNLAHIDFRPNDINAHPPGLEIALSSIDVHRDYKRAVEAGARSVSLPKSLPWGQVVAYVRDLNGVLVEIASELKTPLKK
jgi:uncharacterized glyoxalase superfamily protein PhnB